MKHLLSILLITLTISACNGGKKSTSESVEIPHIDVSQTTVIYFHSNHRCATCMAVEQVAKEALNEDIPFYSIDITLDKNQELIKQYGIAGQTLLVVKGEEKINVTNEAFMFARSKPEKVKSTITAAINSL